MNFRGTTLHFIVSSFIVFVFTCSLSCIFSPKTGKKGSQPEGQWVDPTTPRKVVNNLQVAFNQLDIDFFERCLHENYFYRSPSNIDSLDIAWPRSEDVRIVGNIMKDCREIIFIPSEISIYEEYGSNRTDRPEDAALDTQNEHPDDIWYICSYYITMDLFSNTFGNLKVQQDMKFKMVENPETHRYSIIRWLDENPLVE